MNEHFRGSRSCASSEAREADSFDTLDERDANDALETRLAAPLRHGTPALPAKTRLALEAKRVLKAMRQRQSDTPAPFGARCRGKPPPREDEQQRDANEQNVDNEEVEEQVVKHQRAS